MAPRQKTFDSDVMCSTIAHNMIHDGHAFMPQCHNPYAAPVTIADRIQVLHQLYWNDLEFLLREFTLLLNSSCAVDGGGGPAAQQPRQQSVQKMRFFVGSVQSTMDRVSPAARLSAQSGMPQQQEYTLHQYDLLENHIKSVLLPIKEKLLQQMAAAAEAQGLPPPVQPTPTPPPPPEHQWPMTSIAAPARPPSPPQQVPNYLHDSDNEKSSMEIDMCFVAGDEDDDQGGIEDLFPPVDFLAVESDSDDEMSNNLHRSLSPIPHNPNPTVVPLPVIEQQETIPTVAPPQIWKQPIPQAPAPAPIAPPPAPPVQVQSSIQASTTPAVVAPPVLLSQTAAAALAAASGGSFTQSSVQVPGMGVGTRGVKVQATAATALSLDIPAARRFDGDEEAMCRPRKRLRNILLPVLTKTREVRYECSSCKESYTWTMNCNPWWALVRHECPKCQRMQIPRVDIALPANSVEHHAQVLSACMEQDSDGDGSDGSYTSDDDAEDELAEEDQLEPTQAAKLLVLMGHARDCPGRHADPRHAEVCRSTKFLMLHIRDCSGYAPPMPGAAPDAPRQPCAHQWCKPCRHLLYHLVKCVNPASCAVCNPIDLPAPLRHLRDLTSRLREVSTAGADGNTSPSCANVAPILNRDSPTTNATSSLTSLSVGSGSSMVSPPSAFSAAGVGFITAKLEPSSQLVLSSSNEVKAETSVKSSTQQHPPVQQGGNTSPHASTPLVAGQA